MWCEPTIIFVKNTPVHQGWDFLVSVKDLPLRTALGPKAKGWSGGRTRSKIKMLKKLMRREDGRRSKDAKNDPPPCAPCEVDLFLPKYGHFGGHLPADFSWNDLTTGHFCVGLGLP